MPTLRHCPFPGIPSRVVGAGLARDVHCVGVQIPDPSGSVEEGIAGKARLLQQQTRLAIGTHRVIY